MKTIMMIPNNSAMTRLTFEIFRRSVAKPVGPVLAASFFLLLIVLGSHGPLLSISPAGFSSPTAPGSKSFHSVQMI